VTDGGGSSSCPSQRRKSISRRSVSAALTTMPGTRAASTAFAAGTTAYFNPVRIAASTAGSTPRTGRTAPSSPSSPMRTACRKGSAGTAPAAARSDVATARSNDDPDLGRCAGSRFTVTRRCGQASPELTTAARTLSRAWVSAASGSPDMTRHGRPFATSVSTTTN
jgi:hypothetical protein